MLCRAPQTLYWVSYTMKNLIYALLAGAAVFLGFFATGLLSAFESVAPAVLAVLVAYFLLARRSFKRVEVIFTEASKALSAMPPKLDLAVQTLEKAYPLGKEQFGVTSQVDMQIGVIYYLQQEFNKALPYLKRSLAFGHWLGGAMLGVLYYKKKDHAEMKKTMDIVVRKAKGQSLPWNLYAYLLTQIGENDAAQRVLVDALKATKNDEKIKESLLALQNGKKIKMKVYREQWYQFHLERPPVDQAQAQYMMGGGRVSRMARRGRW